MGHWVHLQLSYYRNARKLKFRQLGGFEHFSTIDVALMYDLRTIELCG
jgi:hypothetical protein